MDVTFLVTDSSHQGEIWLLLYNAGKEVNV